MYNKITIFFFFFISLTTAYSQKPTTQNLPKFDHRFIHFGFLIGGNSANFVLERLPPTVIGADTLTVLEPNSASGFNLGIVSAMHFNQYFSLRFTPNLAFSSRSLEYTFQTQKGEKKYIKDIESTLINFPLNIKYKSARVNNFSAYVIFGAAYSLDLAANAGSENLSTNPNDVIVKLKRDDYMGQLGFGTDFYLQYFKFGIELKMSYGIRDLLGHDNTAFSSPIEQLRSKMFLLSLTFEG
ncbi:MAG: PorT family protein [Vicingus serpentipes]|nr:PorT family protein [Vicingus serpentipes]